MLIPPAALEALLFASGEPLEKKRLCSLLGIKESELDITLKALNEHQRPHLLRGLQIIVLLIQKSLAF